MNKVFFIGRLTRDPELQTTPTGVSVCRFALAVNREFKSQNGETQTDFFNVTAWRGLGEIVSKYCTKGSKIMVEGSIQIRNYEDNQGNMRTAVDVIASNVEFLTQKNAQSGTGTAEGNGSTNSTNGKRKPVLQAFEDDSDIPF